MWIVLCEWLTEILSMLLRHMVPCVLLLLLLLLSFFYFIILTHAYVPNLFVFPSRILSFLFRSFFIHIDSSGKQNLCK